MGPTGPRPHPYTRIGVDHHWKWQACEHLAENRRLSLTGSGPSVCVHVVEQSLGNWVRQARY